MSTSVYYKGAKLIDVDNNTKTLLTAGKYLEDDVTLTDVTVYQTHTVTLTNSGSNYMAYIEHNGVSYYSSDDVIDVSDGDTIKIWLNYGNNNILYVNEEKIAEATAGMAIDYTYTVTSDVEIGFSLSFGASSVRLTEISDIQALSVTENGTYTASGTTRGYSPVTVSVPDPSTSSLTVTPTESQQTFNATGVYGYKPVTINGISSTYVGTGIARKSSTDTTFTSTNGTFTAPIGYYSAAATKTLTTQAAQTIYPSTATQYVSSYRWLTGSQTIKSVTTSNLTAENIASGVIVKVGDSDNASRITQITGTHTGSATPSEQYYKATLMNYGATNFRNYIRYNNKNYYQSGSTFYFKAGDTISYYGESITGSYVYSDGTRIYSSTAMVWGYDYIAPAHPLNIMFSSGVCFNSPTISISSNGIYDVTDYASASVSVSGSVDGFIVTLSQNAYGSLTIDKTFSEIISAYNASKKIAAYGDGSPYYAGTVFVYDDGNGDEVGVNCYSLSGDDLSTVFCEDAYTFLSNSSIFQGTYYYYEPHNMNATPSDVASGKRFINWSGFQVGTATGGGGFTADEIALRAISGDISGSATSIGSYAFYNCSSLTTVSFPSATSIGSYAFAYCSALTTISFPSVTTIGASAFTYCPTLTTVSFPSATSIGSYAFSNCSALTTISFPSVTNIGTSAFVYCSALTTISFPRTISIGFSAFRGCTRLTTISFPNVRSIGTSAFYNCSSLTTASFPSATSIGSYAFYNCHLLTIASFPSATSIGNSVFGYCYSFLSLYLLGSSVPTLGTGTFVSTPIGGYTTSTSGVYGSIFVPSSLYDQYIVATNWSAYSARIVSV